MTARVSLELLRLNRQLKLLGRRVCPLCERNLALDDVHWYVWTRVWRNGTVHTEYSPRCKRCTSVLQSDRAMRQYRASEALRERRRAQNRASYHANLERNRTRSRENRRRLRAAKKREAFEQLMGKRGAG